MSDESDEKKKAELERQIAAQQARNEQIREAVRPFMNEITHYIFHQLQMPGSLDGDLFISAKVRDGLIVEANVGSNFDRKYSKDADNAKKV